PRVMHAHAAVPVPELISMLSYEDRLPPGLQLLWCAHTADVHEEDVRAIEEEVVVQRGHLEPVVEGSAHRGIHLRLGQGHVAHDDRLVARSLECSPRREALERLHLYPGDAGPESATGPA